MRFAWQDLEPGKNCYNSLIKGYSRFVLFGLLKSIIDFCTMLNVEQENQMKNQNNSI
ncbi:hypothetical protein SAMN05443252_101385 [Bacillus sp. OV322]|nr:hypothetical protein SAMN05443252_101385 [Bacillus sp. OV322]